MKKVIVIGCPGSGKTTFAEKLSKKTGLALYHLDAIWHRSDRTHISRDEFDARLSELLALEEYIIDGHYGRTLERRIAACDTVIFFDIPTFDCLAGARERLGKGRADMPWIETEDDEEFLTFVREYNEKSRPDVLKLLEKYCEKQIFVFHTRDEADSFLKGL